ncbi:MAG: hypothetical protein MJE66_22300 [Proteobacteria bacterium]|nr:hypothetical protein [Pseudomonadota bacterium]
MAPTSATPDCDPEELERFSKTFLYREAGILLDTVTRLDRAAKVIEGRLDTNRNLPLAGEQRTSDVHPGHVAGAELLQVTGILGCLHAWFFYGCRWDEGWAGFGNRIHRADFKTLAHLGPPLSLRSEETRARVGPRRLVLRFTFQFEQEGRVVYTGDQTAMFMKDQPLAP